MKRLVILFISAYSLASCTTIRVPVEQYSGSIDYSKYTDQGFFITEANSVSFDYKPIASVYSIFKTGYEVSSKAGTTQKDDLYAGTSMSIKTTNRIVAATIDGVVSELYTKAKSIGANGIIGLEITYIGDARIIGSGYQATGMAIRK